MKPTHSSEGSSGTPNQSKLPSTLPPYAGWTHTSVPPNNQALIYFSPSSNHRNIQRKATANSGSLSGTILRSTLFPNPRFHGLRNCNVEPSRAAESAFPWMISRRLLSTDERQGAQPILLTKEISYSHQLDQQKGNYHARKRTRRPHNPARLYLFQIASKKRVGIIGVPQIISHGSHRCQAWVCGYHGFDESSWLYKFRLDSKGSLCASTHKMTFSKYPSRPGFVVGSTGYRSFLSHASKRRLRRGHENCSMEAAVDVLLI